jgi:hypothetical protein
MHVLHEEARARGVMRVWLEVIEQNEGAFRMYEKLGYEVTRELDVLTLDAETPPGSGREASADEAHSQIQALRNEREPWQRADGALVHYDDLLGMVGDHGAAVYRLGPRVNVLQVAGDDVADAVRSLRAKGPLTALNFPAGGPVASALEAAGASRIVRQREMLLQLS